MKIKRVVVKQMGAKKFREFLVSERACDEAMAWYDKQPKRDLRSVVSAVTNKGWLIWLVRKLRARNLIRFDAYQQTFGRWDYCSGACVKCYAEEHTFRQIKARFVVGPTKP